MKRTLLSIVARTGGFSPFRLAHRRQALIVTYHRFTAGGGGHGAIPVTALEAQLDYLTHRYDVVPLRWLAARLAAGRPPGGPVAAITVDDGYADVHDVAMPVFARFGAPATVFVVTGFLDGECWIWTDTVRYVLRHTGAAGLDVTIGGHRVACALASTDARRLAALRVNRRLKAVPDAVKEETIRQLARQLGVTVPPRPPRDLGPLTWTAARALEASGLEIGSHTVTHPMLTQIDASRLARELQESRVRLRDELSSPPDLFCYPNGGVDGTVRAAVRDAGYRAAVTTVPGFNDVRTDPYALRRIHTERDLPHFIQSTSGFELVKARLRATVPAPFPSVQAP
jgi:peptidoglycan/xylan/chitin deacetylase (PgdA/CDA1 family)